MLNVYAYTKCGTCQKATKFLDAHSIPYKTIAIREQPPTKPELTKMLGAYEGNIRKLFNTSGMDYKAMKLKDTLPDMSDKQAIELLTQHGNLVKRPFVVGGDVALVGFNEDVWREALL
jgi:Spx/MgsR family transcriptional regulator